MFSEIERLIMIITWEGFISSELLASTYGRCRCFKLLNWEVNSQQNGKLADLSIHISPTKRPETGGRSVFCPTSDCSKLSENHDMECGGLPFVFLT